MATDVPQRDLRNRTAELLRRVERGERLRITVHGHAVAELRAIDHVASFVPSEELRRDLTGVLHRDDPLDLELRAADEQPSDPFA